MVKMKTDPAQILVNRLLEAEENVDWSPDPEAEPIHYRHADWRYPMSFQELASDALEDALQKTVEVPRSLWLAYKRRYRDRFANDHGALNEYVAELVTGHKEGLQNIEFKQATGYRAKNPDNIVLRFRAEVAFRLLKNEN